MCAAPVAPTGPRASASHSGCGALASPLRLGSRRRRSRRALGFLSRAAERAATLVLGDAHASALADRCSPGDSRLVAGIRVARGRDGGPATVRRRRCPRHSGCRGRHSSPRRAARAHDARAAERSSEPSPAAPFPSSVQAMRLPRARRTAGVLVRRTAPSSSPAASSRCRPRPTNQVGTVEAMTSSGVS